MARGTQHLKRRPAGAQPSRTRTDESAVRRQQRAERKAAEAGMFFPKLRTHARWMFVLLALVFAGGFVLFGVGSGSNGIGNVLQDWLHIGQASSGPSISSLEHKTQKNPQDAQAWSDLATAYETKQRSSDAVRALEHLVALRPKSADALQQLVGQYQRQLQEIATQGSAIQASSPAVDVTTFEPAATTALGRAFQSPTALQDPIQNALTTNVSDAIGKLQTRYSAIQKQLLAADRKVAALDPTDPNSQYQLATAADGAGDTVTAKAAYEKFLKLSPDDPLAGQVKQRLEQLSG